MHDQSSWLSISEQLVWLSVWIAFRLDVDERPPETLPVFSSLSIFQRATYNAFQEIVPSQTELAYRLHFRKLRMLGKSDGGSAFEAVPAEIAKPGARGTPSSGLWLFVFLLQHQQQNGCPTSRRFFERWEFVIAASAAILLLPRLDPSFPRRLPQHHRDNSRSCPKSRALSPPGPGFPPGSAGLPRTK